MAMSDVCIWDVMLCRDNSVEAGHGHLTVMNTQCSQCSVYNIHYEVSIQRAVMAVQVESVSGSVAMFTHRQDRGRGPHRPVQQGNDSCALL